jgi:hypothetical protein
MTKLSVSSRAALANSHFPQPENPEVISTVANKGAAAGLSPASTGTDQVPRSHGAELPRRSANPAASPPKYLPFVCFAKPPTTTLRAGGTMGPDPGKS